MYKDMCFEAKYAFAKNVKTKEFKEKYKKSKITAIIAPFLNFIIIPVAFGATFIFEQFSLTTSVGRGFMIVISIISLILAISTLVSAIKDMHKLVTDASFSSVTFKEYKELLESGELDRIIIEGDRLKEEKAKAEEETKAKE